jgi:hypothetical protein
MILTPPLECMDLTGNPIKGTLPVEICDAPRAKILSTCDLGNSDCSCCEQCFEGSINSPQACDFYYATDDTNIDRIPDEVKARFLGRTTD